MVDNLEALLGPDTCRLCLKTGRSPTPVSNENLEGSLMAIKIDILTSVKVAPSDKVCPMCRINVKNFYDFRIMCVQSDARIKGFAAKVANTSQEDLAVIKSDQVIRSYKRIRRTEDVDRSTGEVVKPLDPVQGTVNLFKSTADLFKSKAEGNGGGGLFKLKTKPVLVRSDDAFRGLKRPLILSGNHSTSAGNRRSEGKPQKSTADSQKSVGDPLSAGGDPLSSGKSLLSDQLRSTKDPLSSASDPLSSASDPLSSASDPLSSATDPLSSAVYPLSPGGETHNITVEPLMPDQEDAEDSSEAEKESSQGGFTVKIENMLDESFSDTQSNHDDNVDSDGGSEGELDAETDSDKLVEEAKDSVSEEPSVVKIKEELPEYEPEESRNEENMEEMEIKPEEVIIPEMKREPDDLELFMENECEDEDYTREEASFSEEPASQIKRETKRDDTESMEVLVDPLMLMDEDHDARVESKLSSLSPVLGNGRNVKNGKLPLPPLNGARSDKQRGLDFVKQLLGQNEKAADGAAGGEAAEKPYRCASCDINFAYYKSYMKHKERHLGVQSTYACNHCTATYPSNRELHIHMRKHTEKSFSCDRCYRAFPSKDRLDSHYSLHTGDKAHVCDFCKKSFAYKSSFVFHMRKQHGEVITGGTFLRCPKCPTEWNSPSELRQHMEMHSSDEIEITSFSCPICSMTFPSKSILNVHARIHQKPLK